MTDTELRELDAWIAEHVMGWHRKTNAQHMPDVDWSDYTEGFANELTPYWHGADGTRDVEGECDCGQHNTEWHPTNDPATAMEVLKKCCEKENITISYWDKGFQVGRTTWAIGSPSSSVDLTKGETLETTICLFAKKLFGGHPPLAPS